MMVRSKVMPDDVSLNRKMQRWMTDVSVVFGCNTLFAFNITQRNEPE
jgi:hypothetical protein